MKKVLAAMALGSVLALPAMAQVGVGVNVTIGDPNFFGQIQIGNMAPPPLVAPQPVFVSPVPVAGPPIYLRVPPEQIRDWRHYCHRYHACDQRVLFVRDDWYRNEYAPRYMQEHPRHGEMERHEMRDEHHEMRDERHDDRHDARHDERHHDERGDYRN